LSISIPIEAGHCCHGLKTIFEITVPRISIMTSKTTSLAVKAPKDDEDRPELGDDLPRMNRRVEVLPEEDDAHTN
jgi:hypothetical protein